MKFLCVECDAQMASVGQRDPGDGTLGILFRCPTCAREVAMLANPMETQMVSSLCVQIGGRETAEQPFEMVRSRLESAAATPPEGAPAWSAEAEARLERVPGFVRDAIRRMYSDWARERDITEITPEVMDRARSALDLEGM